MARGELVPDDIVVDIVDRAHRRSRTRARASSSTAFRARCRRPRRSTACWRKQGLELDAVIELQGRRGRPAQAHRKPRRRDEGPRRAAARRRQSRGAARPARGLPRADRAADRLLPPAGRAAHGRRHGADRRVRRRSSKILRASRNDARRHPAKARSPVFASSSRRKLRPRLAARCRQSRLGKPAHRGRPDQEQNQRQPCHDASRPGTRKRGSARPKTAAKSADQVARLKRRAKAAKRRR